jgi:DTW domain-containing protein YfiP
MSAPVLTTRRPICTLCRRPQSGCVCQWIEPISTAVEVLILQHPLEVDHAKNTARLLHLSLPNSTMLMGEAFDASTLPPVAHADKYTVLLYPQTQHNPVPLADPVRLRDLKQLRLIVLDATWRKSRKMLHANPWLQELPRLSLDNAPTSHYVIRKAHKPGQLATLEATCAALTQLEGDIEKYQPLLQAFKGFVAQQKAFATNRIATT